MKRYLGAYSLGLVSGLLIAYAAHRYVSLPPAMTAKAPDVCYSCFWQVYDPKFRSDFIEFYRQYRNQDPLVNADARYILSRTTGAPNCDIRAEYQRVLGNDGNAARRFVAASILAFSAEECGVEHERALGVAAQNAETAGFSTEAHLLRSMAAARFTPAFAETPIQASIVVPPGATRFILGESKLELTPNMRVGTQVERVARDWISYQLRWSLDDQPLSSPTLAYHEGAFVLAMQAQVPLAVYPLTGAIAVRKDNKWYAPDDTGTFRFQVLDDKIQYPTTHVFGDNAWIEDTHGISALVPQAIEQKVALVVGCGDSEGKAKAAYYLAQKGINVIFPGDRYQDLLLGYQGKGVLLGSAPVHVLDGHTYVGGQPVAFSTKEWIIVQDTKKLAPVQYYDAPARYFRKLSEYAGLKLDFVEVDAQDELYRVLARARERDASVIAVRIMTEAENAGLRGWLQGSPKRRAILFHSGLYPYAQKLFADFPQQVTFGDLHPRFE